MAARGARKGTAMTETSVQEEAKVGKGAAAVFALARVDELTPNPQNPRRRLSEAALEELAASVAEKGVLQPLLVRRLEGDALQIVAGERRWRAAKLAGLEQVPVLVADLTDDEALELAVIENLQREDVHPMDEAAGFDALLKHGHDVASLAARVGKSEAHVYQRLKLLSLSKKCQQQFLEDKIPATVALALARIPSPKLQDEALPRVADMPSTHAVSYLRNVYMLELGSAPFPTDDADLVPEAGSCLVCPKRTGNQALLFADIKSRDLCTDPPCFQKKREAAVQRKLEQARAEGRTVLSGAQVKKVLPHGHVDSKSGYVNLDEYDHRLGKSLRQAAGKKALEALPPTSVVLAPVKQHDGSIEIRELVPRAVARKLAPTPKRDVSDARQARAEVCDVALKLVLAAAQDCGAELDVLRWLASVEVGLYPSQQLLKQYGAKKPADLQKKIASFGERPLVGLLVAVALEDSALEAAWLYGDGYPEALTSACKVFGVDLAGLERSKKAEAAQPGESEPTKKGKPAAAKKVKAAKKAKREKQAKGRAA